MVIIVLRFQRKHDSEGVKCNSHGFVEQSEAL